MPAVGHGAQPEHRPSALEPVGVAQGILELRHRQLRQPPSVDGALQDVLAHCSLHVFHGEVDLEGLEEQIYQLVEDAHPPRTMQLAGGHLLDVVRSPVASSPEGLVLRPAELLSVLPGLRAGRVVPEVINASPGNARGAFLAVHGDVLGTLPVEPRYVRHAQVEELLSQKLRGIEDGDLALLDCLADLRRVDPLLLNWPDGRPHVHHAVVRDVLGLLPLLAVQGSLLRHYVPLLPGPIDRFRVRGGLVGRGLAVRLLEGHVVEELPLGAILVE
mmetsp:Transcript_13874/g.31456  ORF Transcript_13874/g.31456 Transcript_13874/m.31456 type:complete len:273 (-) Transcript_13874:228-1046(-)